MKTTLKVSVAQHHSPHPAPDPGIISKFKLHYRNLISKHCIQCIDDDAVNSCQSLRMARLILPGPDDTRVSYVAVDDAIETMDALTDSEILALASLLPPRAMMTSTYQLMECNAHLCATYLKNIADLLNDLQNYAAKNRVQCTLDNFLHTN